MFNILLIIMIIVIYLLTHLKKNKNNDYIFLVVTFIIFFFLVGFRSVYSGNDTLTYLNLFDYCKTLKFDILENTRYETGYLIFNIFLGYFNIDHRLFLIIFSAIFNFHIFKFIKDNSTNYFLSVMMYVGLLFFYLSMTMFRQFFAMMIRS